MEAQNSSIFSDSPIFNQRFEVMEELGRGGMSVVYRAKHLGLQREIALKILNPEFALTPAYLEKFRQEAHAYSILNHDNIVQILQFGSDDKGRPFIAMELLSGKTLEALFSEGKKLSSEEFRKVFMPVMDAMEYAHNKNIVHRDLKPANIMICNDSEQENLSLGDDSSHPSNNVNVKVLDFGIAKLLELDNNSKEQNSTTGFVGSPLYMSPEQIAGTGVDCRTDIYSLACIMYQSITGQPPFMGENALETMYERLHNSVPKIEGISGSLCIPKELADVLMEALARDPARRPDSMTEFRKRISIALSSKQLFRRRKMVVALPLASGICLVALLCFAIVSQMLQQRNKNDVWTSQMQPQMKQPSQVISGYALLRQGIELREYQHDFQGAKDKFKEAIRRLETQKDRETLQNAYRKLGMVCQDLNQFPESAAAYRKLLSLYDESSIGGSYPDAGTLAECLDRMGKQDEADSIFRKYIASARKTAGDNAFEPLAEILERYGNFLCAHKRYKEALKVYVSCLDNFDRHSKKRISVPAISATWRIYQIERDLHNKLDLNGVYKTKSHLLNSDNSEIARFMAQFGDYAKDNGYFELAREMYEISLARPDENPKVKKDNERHCQEGLRLVAEQLKASKLEKTKR